MAQDSSDLLVSPVHERHVTLGAKFAEFGGWSMPLDYAGAVKEHTAVREGVGVFDVSHLGKAVVRGPGAASYVNSCLTNDLGKIAPGKAQYTLCCADDGGVVDDLIAYLRSDDEVFLIPNAANTTEVVRRLAASAPDDVEVINLHRDYAIFAVQGTLSDEVLGAMGFPVGHEYMSFVEVLHDEIPVVVCRTGYTGERGYELVVPNAAAVSVWDAILAAGEAHGIVACGLAARDTLRTEMGYPLHGQDISLSITPVQARLGWAVGWKKESFWGDEALRAEKAAGAVRVLRGVVAAGRGIPRPGMTVLSADEAELGVVTSGTFSPTRRVGVGLALLDASVADGDQVFVDVRGRREAFEVTKPPFVTPGVRES
jgi:aminomethyltransferase